jgi:hypothetical protein
MIWLGGERLPGYDADQGWQRLLGDGWTLTVWGDDDDWPVASKVRDVLDNAAVFAPHNDATRWRTDVLRLAVLHSHGGVYCDLDVHPMRDLAPLTGDCGAWLAETPNRLEFPTNAAMGFPAGHPLLTGMLNDIDMRVTRHVGVRTVDAVGAGWLAEVMPAYPDVQLMPWWMFASRSITGRRKKEPHDPRNAEYGFMNHRYGNTARKDKR